MSEGQVRDEERTTDEGQVQAGAAEAQAGRLREIAREALEREALTRTSTRRGVVDVDAAWKLLDRSGVKVDVEKGEVTGIEEAVERLLTERPWLGRVATSAGSPGGGTPPATRPAGEETLSARVKRQFARRMPGGVSVTGGSTGGLRIR